MLKTSHVARFGAVFFIAYVVWTVGGWSQGTAQLVVSDITALLVSSTAVVLSALATRSAQGRLRAAWAALTVGLLGWAVGDAIWAYHELVLGEFPFPSAADAAYLLLPVGACAAMLLFPTARSAQSQIRLVLDGVIVAASLFLVSWLTVLRSVFDAGAETRLGLAVSLAYPVSDLVVLTVAAYVLIRAGSYERRSLILFTLGMACIAVSDTLFVYLSAKDQYSSGDPIDIGWIAGLLLIMVAVAAAHGDDPGARPAVHLPSWASVWLPYAPLMAAGIVAATQPVELLRSVPVQLTAVGLVVTVLARQFLVVSENRQLVSGVAEQALRDPLTGLANRDLFHDRLDHAVQLLRRDGLTVAVIAIDLNDFKLVNDTMGHPAGDELLKRAGERILGCVRVGDTVARVGGDEFAVLVEGDIDHSSLIAQRLLEAFDQPFVIEDRDLLIRPSVGLAIADSDDLDLSSEELYRRADQAMYAAKRSRLGGVTTYTAELARIDDSDDQLLSRPGLLGHDSGAAMLRLLGELRYAIDHSQLDLAYQPQVDLSTGKIVGVEALLRWPHPVRGVLGPEQFLPLVRQHGLMGSVNAFVLDRALDEAVRWHSAGAGVRVAINLFAPSISDPGLPDRIAQALTDRGLSAAALTVEVTEDCFLHNVGSAQSVLNRLRECGTRISIDDFGSGYSALSYLRDLPVDEVKLDRDFIVAVPVDRRAAAVVSAVVDLAHALGLITVVEGVENAATADRLRALGCDVAQGYYFSPPLGADELLDRLTRSPAPVSVRSS